MQTSTQANTTMHPTWGVDVVLEIELADQPDADHPYRVEGLEDFAAAAVRLAPAASLARPATPWLRLRPLLEPVGPFDLTGITMVQLFREDPGRTRSDFVTFERRIGRRYYDFMAPARHRYGGICTIESAGIGLTDTIAEPYSIDAGTREEALDLDATTSPEPADIVEIYAECRPYKVPGSVHVIWLIPA
jgi:hypothetical protein